MLESLVLDPRVVLRKKKDVLSKAIRITTIDEEHAAEFGESVCEAVQTGQPFIPIVIDSFGGDPYAMWTMVDVLTSVQLPVATVVEGKAMSCGAVLFSCGTEGLRFVGPNATIMIHDVLQLETNDRSTAENLMAEAKETGRLSKKMYEFMERRIGKPRGYLRKQARAHNADWYLTPKEACQHNLANHIKIPVLKTTVSVSVALEY